MYVRSCIQSLCWINFHISKDFFDSFPGKFLKSICCISQNDSARTKFILCNKLKEVCIQLCRNQSCVNSGRFEIRSQVCSKPQQSFVLLKSEKSPQPAYHLDLDHQPHRGFHRVRSSECFIVHVNTFFTSQQQTVAKPWEA